MGTFCRYFDQFYIDSQEEANELPIGSVLISDQSDVLVKSEYEGVVEYQIANYDFTIPQSELFTVNQLTTINPVESYLVIDNGDNV